MIKQIKSGYVLAVGLLFNAIAFGLIFYSQYLERGFIRKIELLFLAAVVVLGVFFVFRDNKVYRLICKWINVIIDKRFIVAVIVFAVLVIGNVSGSSMKLLDSYMGESAQSSKTVGSVRGIRSDEWSVNTEYHFAQVYEDEYFPVINDNIGEDGQNMLLACNSPVMHISLIGKPQTWGYFIFGASRGLSWFWWFRVIALVLGAFEVGMILSKNNKKLSLLLAVLIGLMPMMHWWLSTSLVDIVVAGQWMFTGFYYFLFKRTNKEKILPAVCFVISTLGFGFSLYPALQVTFGYMLLIMFIYYLIAKRKEIVWNKITTVIFLAGLAVIGITAFFFVKDTYPDIVKVMSTVYPGDRICETGNADLKMLFYYGFSQVLPFSEVPFLNNCEVSMPLMFIYAALIAVYYFLIRKNVKQKGLVAALGIFSLVLLSMFVLTWPDVLLKITLLSYTTVTRNVLVIGICIAYMLVIILSEYKDAAIIESKKSRIIAGLASFVIYAITLYFGQAGGFLGIGLIVALSVSFAVMEAMIFANKVTELIIMLLMSVGISTVCINPINIGAASLDSNDVVNEVEAIDAKESGNWIVLDELVVPNVLAANGVNVVNATQYEPNMEYWKLLDKASEYEDVYNRYAHVEVELSDSDTEFQLVQADVMKVLLSYDDIDDAQVDYILTKTELENKSSEVSFEKLSQINKWMIYKVNVN